MPLGPASKQCAGWLLKQMPMLHDGSCLRTSRSWKTLHACELPYVSYVVMQLLNKVLRFSVPAIMAFTELHRFLQLHYCCLTNVIESWQQCMQLQCSNASWTSKQAMRWLTFEANANAPWWKLFTHVKIMEDPACLPTSICIICCDATLKQSAALLSAGYHGIYRASPLPSIALLLFDQCNWVMTTMRATPV